MLTAKQAFANKELTIFLYIIDYKTSPVSSGYLLLTYKMWFCQTIFLNNAIKKQNKNTHKETCVNLLYIIILILL